MPDARARMEELEVPDPGTSRVVKRALSEARLLRERYGCCYGGFNTGGPLNNAVSVFGEEVLVACLTDPELTRSVLRKMGEALLMVDDQMTRPINGSDPASQRMDGGLANCQAAMISPQTYSEVVFPVDRWFREQFNGLWNLHHCGVFHPYAEAYRLLYPSRIDVGRGTDYRATRRSFPHTPISVEVHPFDLTGKTQKEIDVLIAQTVEEAGPLELVVRLWVAEAGIEIPDQTVRDFVTAPARIWG